LAKLNVKQVEAFDKTTRGVEMNINDIDANWGEQVFIWVRPAGNVSWTEFHNSTLGNRNNRDWQPARIDGFVEVERREQYGTGLDSRRVTLLGNTYGYDVSRFEFGDLINPPQALLDLSNEDEPQAAPGLSR
jgi:hypothetical protein